VNAVEEIPQLGNRDCFLLRQYHSLLHIRRSSRSLMPRPRRAEGLVATVDRASLAVEVAPTINTLIGCHAAVCAGCAAP